MLRVRRPVLTSLIALVMAAGCGRETSPTPRPAGANHLSEEKSPYLQRHAHNPVDWYPWGTEAFEKARREHKLIFLSIGYSTCHWCHVMEEESFSNPAIAEVMNRHYVSIKVDREERPDVDRVYLAYVTSVSSGGWPMSVVLTPELKPFFGATYMPPETRDQQEGLRPALERLADAWRTKRDLVLQAAAAGTSIVTGVARIPQPAGASGVRDLDETFTSLTRSFDGEHGGFGGAPKFPRPVVLNFLLRQYARTGATPALEMTLATLRAMAAGGIHDQIEGGFHRYTVDDAWRVPHFEKMLYDQAQLISTYLDAYQASRDASLAAVARGTIEYVRRRLGDEGGAFYSAEDADSRVSQTDTRMAEGAFYLWTLEELQQVLGSDAALVAYHFDVTAGGNLGKDAGPDMAGANTLIAAHPIADTARRFGTTSTKAQQRLNASVERLRLTRDKRPRPALDNKIITAWNGLMISALARAGTVLDDGRYLGLAAGAARFIETHLVDSQTATLKRRFVDGHTDIDGLPDDYAFLIQGLLDLYEASFDPHWLSLALRLQSTQDRLFWDDADGAYFSTRADAAHLLARMKEDYDGAEPTANSVSAMNLVRLWQITDADVWRTRADATFRGMSGRVARSGTAVPQLMAALDFRQAKAKQIVIAGDPSAADTQVLLRLVHDRFIPNKVMAVVDGGTQQQTLGALAPPVAAMTRRNGRATIYVCENYTCNLPTSDPTVAARLLDSGLTTKP